MKKKLTIAIPTINRNNQIINTIKSILSQNNDRINIIVFDSSDNNNLKYTIDDELWFIENLTYIFDVDKLWFDISLLKIAENSNTEYIWFVNDHSDFLLNSIENILKILDDNKYSYLYAPNKHFLNQKNSLDTKSNVLKSTNMNCNIYNRIDFIKYNKFFLDEYGKSYLLFYISQIHIVFDNKKSITLPFECTEYWKYKTNERAKNWWSSNLEKYISTTNYLHLILKDFIKKYNEKKYIQKSLIEDINFIMTLLIKRIRSRKNEYMASDDIINNISDPNFHSKIWSFLIKIILKL